MSTKLLWSAVAGFVLLAFACAGLSPEQQQTAIEGIERLVAAGTISREQADAMIQALTGGGWSRALEIAATIGGAVVTNLAIILGWRGPITARKGEPIPAKTA